MNKVNFDSMKRFKAPEAWIEKAASIPAAIPTTVLKRRTAFPVYRFAAAASIVLVSAIGLLVFLLHRGAGELTVAPHSQNATQPPTAAAETVGESSYTAPILSDPTALSADGRQPTAGAAGRQATESAVNETAPSATVFAQHPMSRPDDPTAASQPTIIAPSAPFPTEVPKPTDPPSPIQPPTEPYRPPGDCEIYGTFSLGTAGGSGNYVAEETSIFCRLYDSSGRLVGDSPLFHPQREAKILSRNSDGSVLAYYNPVEKGMYITEDSYVYVFYDIHGNELYRDVKFVF
ncbi:MAG: hypothetical protein IJH40_04690 [Ruminococcus sp.]|uniref:hypothetical protein n=1 Tax=Ruminococcus sp. TaxID=41978 RepID=UPI0028731E15|nr:hypothetical protein [Ruminococcus sp.]MBQ3284923.1 hypothetical protein [Ruminococcus sp.]